MNADDTPRSFMPALASVHFIYGRKNTKSEPRCSGEATEACAASQADQRLAPASSSCPGMGEQHDAAHDRGRKNRPAALYDLSRDLYFDRFARLRAGFA